MTRPPAALADLAAVLIAPGPGFRSAPVASATLVFGGLAGDAHTGLTRPACARTPWHKRRTPIANTRQVSIVSAEECAAIAAALGIAALDPGLIGANLVLRGLPSLTALPPATRLCFPSGATLFVTEPNAPCRQAGRAVAAALSKPELEFAFVTAARSRRGLVAMVEAEGPLTAGDALRVIAPARP